MKINLNSLSYQSTDLLNYSQEELNKKIARINRLRLISWITGIVIILVCVGMGSALYQANKINQVLQNKLVRDFQTDSITQLYTAHGEDREFY